jgi:hypothetical protein
MQLLFSLEPLFFFEKEKRAQPIAHVRVQEHASVSRSVTEVKVASGKCKCESESESEGEEESAHVEAQRPAKQQTS